MTHHGWMTANDSPDTSPQAGMHHVLRPAVAADAPALAQLGRESFCAAFGHLYRADALGQFLHEASDEAVVAREIADDRFPPCLAEADGPPLGSCPVNLPHPY